jgi:hypothetical protein
MLSSQTDMLNKYPHRVLIQQVLMDMVKATRCPHCGRGRTECLRKFGNLWAYMLEPDINVGQRPRCSVDLSDVKQNIEYK